MKFTAPKPIDKNEQNELNKLFNPCRHTERRIETAADDKSTTYTCVRCGKVEVVHHR